MGYLCVERTIDVPLEKVWPIAGDFTKSPDPTLPIEIVVQGDETKMGVGCERKIRSGKTVFHDQLISIDPPNSYSYKMLFGSPVKYQNGKVAFMAVGKSTQINWTVNYAVKYPGTGWVFRMVTKKYYNKFIDELEKIK